MTSRNVAAGERCDGSSPVKHDTADKELGHFCNVPHFEVIIIVNGIDYMHSRVMDKFLGILYNF